MGEINEPHEKNSGRQTKMVSFRFRKCKEIRTHPLHHQSTPSEPKSVTQRESQDMVGGLVSMVDLRVTLDLKIA